jgi:hypothetical protein
VKRFKRWSHKRVWDKVFEELKPKLNEEKEEIISIKLYQ